MTSPETMTTDLAAAPPRCNPATVEHFLTDLFGDVPEGAHAYLWRKQGDSKQTDWFDRGHVADAAIRAGEATEQGCDVWCGVGLAAKPRGPKQRLTNETAAGMVGFVADVDFAKAGSPKQYPADADAAAALIDDFPLPPTIIVHSGHGLQVWWLFPAPWLFAADEQRAQAAALSLAWGKHLQALAKDRGFDLDSVHELARVMRVAGTVNQKDPQAPVPVTVLRNGGPRHSPDAFRAILPANAQPELGDAPDREPAAPKTRGTRQVPATAARGDFPAAKHEALYANDELYRRTWDRDRPDLKDQSPNAYDMALANICARAELDFEDIGAILYERRRRHGEDPEKALRPDYLKLTIGKALALVRGEQIVAGQAEPESREERVAALATTLAIPLVNVQRVTGAEPLFRFILGEGGEVAALPAKAILNQSTFRAAVFAACGEPPKQQKRGEAWDNILRAIHRAAEVLDAGADATLDGEVRAWLEEYLSSNRPVVVEPGEAVEHPKHPFLREGRVWINLAHLQRFLAVGGTRLQTAVLAQRLKTCGGEQATHRVRAGREATHVRYWGLPWNP